MQVISIEHPYRSVNTERPIVLALGFFDGIHRGHQAVIARAREIADERQIPLALMSFHQHPSIVFQQKDPKTIRYISPMKRKMELLEQFGVDRFYVLEFDEQFANVSPQEFVDMYIVGLQAEVVVAGFDYTYGPRTIANMGLLPMYAQGRFEIETVEKFENQEGKVSSTAVRKALEKGDMTVANQLLGYIYQFSGTVIHGFGRGGKLLGYPTANLSVANDVLLPAIGVYSVKVQVAGVWYKGMASIGYNPTFKDVEKLAIEVNILDFDQDIYGEEIKVEWHHYLRPELTFTTIEELIAQLDHDQQATRDYFLSQAVN